MRNVLFSILIFSLLLVSCAVRVDQSGTSFNNENLSSIVAGKVNTSQLIVRNTTTNATFQGDVQIIGTLYGGSPLKVAGGVRLFDCAPKPTCDVSTRGAICPTFGALGVADTIEVCVKTILDAYTWTSLT